MFFNIGPRLERPLGDEHSSKLRTVVNYCRKNVLWHWSLAGLRLMAAGDLAGVILNGGRKRAGTASSATSGRCCKTFLFVDDAPDE